MEHGDVSSLCMCLPSLALSHSGLLVQGFGRGPGFGVGSCLLNFDCPLPYPCGPLQAWNAPFLFDQEIPLLGPGFAHAKQRRSCC